MVAVLVLASILGIPLGITMLSALNVLAPIGYVTTSLIIGRLFVKGKTNRSRIGAFFAGFGILRLLALIPGVGFIVWFVACVYGIGAASMAAWYGGHRMRDTPGTIRPTMVRFRPRPHPHPPAPPAESTTAAVPVTVPAEPTTETSTESVSVRPQTLPPNRPHRTPNPSPRLAEHGAIPARHPRHLPRRRLHLRLRRPCPGGIVECGQCHVAHRADTLELHRLERLEGDSDPSEMLAVCAVSCPNCGIKGCARAHVRPGVDPGGRRGPRAPRRRPPLSIRATDPNPRA